MGKALVPLSIISGFKYSGVYPFNPEIVLEKCLIVNPAVENSTSVAHGSASSKPDDDGDNEDASSADEEGEVGDFTKEEEAKFLK